MKETKIEERKDCTSKNKDSFFSIQGIKSLIVLTVLVLTCFLGFGIRLFSVIRFESIIHEFDPWFNYRCTRYMVSKGFYNFLNWFDERAWYPLGRIVGGTVFPGLMITSGTIHWFLHMIGIPLHIREVCVFLAPVFSGFTAIATYLLTSELFDKGAGLFSAIFIAVAPGYLSRSVAGSYDNEAIAIFALMFTYYLWIKSLRTGSIFWSLMTAFSYMYMVSAWGGYVFIINLIPLHVFILILMGRFSTRLYVSYSIFFVLGTLLSMQIPFVGFQPVRTSEHMAALGTFLLIQACKLFYWIRSRPNLHLKVDILFFLGIASTAGSVFFIICFLTYIGVIAPWSGRFYSLWDTAYAKLHIPIITSVSEHQPTTWTSFYFDLHILICLFPAGVWFAIKDLTDQKVFIVLYAVFASYFAGVMIRLMLTLTPVVCVLAGAAISRLIGYYFLNESSLSSSISERKVIPANVESSDADTKFEPASQEKDEVIGLNLKLVVIFVLGCFLTLFFLHCTWISSHAYSSPSIILASYRSDGTRYIIDDYREAYSWLSQNTPSDARIMSWWDYGYQIAGLANRTTLVDNNTWNNTHIAIVGKAMSSNETVAYEILKALDVDYVLVIFGGLIAYSGDDINKFLWMVRIAEGEFPNEIRESDYFTSRGEFLIDSRGAPALLNSLMYSLSFYRYGEVQTSPQIPPGFDHNRHSEIGRKNIRLKHLEEAFTSEHWIVRIYRVKKPENFYGEPTELRKLARRKSIYQKPQKGKRGKIIPVSNSI